MNPSMNIPLNQFPFSPKRQNGVVQWHFRKICHPNQEFLQRPMDFQFPSFNTNGRNFTKLFYLKSDHLINQKLPNIPYIPNNIILNSNQNNINVNLQQLSEYGSDQRNDYDHNQKNLQMLQSFSNNENQIQENVNKELKCANLILKGGKKGNDYDTNIKEEIEENVHASIDIYILPSTQGDSEIEGEKIFKIFYECRKKVNNMIKVKINIKDVILKYKEITLMEIIQKKETNPQSKGEMINYISMEINEGKEEVYVDLKPNGRGKCKYKTEILFKKGNEEIIKIPIELETLRNVRNKPDSIKNEENPKLKYIHNINGIDLILKIFEFSRDEETKEEIVKFFEGLEKYLKGKKLERFLEKEIKFSIFEQINDFVNEGLKEGNFIKEIFTNIENIFNEIEDEKKNKLLIMCFDYLYMRSIDVFKNVDIFRDIGDEYGRQCIIGCLYSYIQIFLGKYGAGYCTKNNIILLFRKLNDRKRSLTKNNEYYVKKRRMSVVTGNDGRQTKEDSDSEDFIS